MLEKIANRLVSVKSIVTVVLTAMFAVLCYQGKLDQNFMVIYTAVITFYFSKAEKKDDGGGGDKPATEESKDNEVKISWPEGVALNEVSKMVAVAQGDRSSGESDSHDTAGR